MSNDPYDKPDRKGENQGSKKGDDKDQEGPIKALTLPPELLKAIGIDIEEQPGGDVPPIGPPPPKDPPDADPLDIPLELPPDCLVTALGYQGRRFFYLNCGGQLVELLDREHTANVILALFGGATSYLEKIWPRYGPRNRQGYPAVVGWREDWVREALLRECVRQGVWHPLYRMRGPGAWADDQGRLVMHYGDDVQVDGTSHPPGLLGNYIYETGAKWPHPALQLAAGGPQGPGKLLLDLLQTWNWKRPELFPYLVLGHIAAGKIGGALHWRPTVWLVGPPGSGKTTLETEVLSPVYGKNGAIYLTDASEAGVRQWVRYASLPIIIDELEPRAGDRRAGQVVQLARYAASGGITARGSAGHIPYQFVVRSCFTFSSVYAAPLNAQDRSRIAVLELVRLAKNAKLPDLDEHKLTALGQLLTRRMVEQWPRFALVFGRFSQAMRRAGHDARACDQYGMLATCMFLALYDGDPLETVLPVEEKARIAALDDLRPDDLGFWVHRFSVEQLAEDNDDEPDHQRCLNHLFGALVDPRRTGERRTIGQVIEEDIEAAIKQVMRNPTRGKAVEKLTELKSQLLDTIGLRVIIQETSDVACELRFEPSLLVANQHRGLLEVFVGSTWAGAADSGGAGWKQALRRAPGAQAGEAVRFGGVKSRVTRVPLEVIKVKI